MTNLYMALERVRNAPAMAFGRAPPPAISRTRFEAEMRALRSQLQALLEERKPTTLAVMGCNHREGATTVTRELARSLALDGVKVLLCGTVAPPTKKRGAEPAQPAASSERRIVATASAMLDFVDIADMHREDSPNTASIVFRGWLETVKGGYDVVLIDAAPLLNHPSWGPMLKPLDGVLLIVEAERTRSIVVKAAVSAIEAAGGHILGIIFNKRRRYIPEVFYRWL